MRYDTTAIICHHVRGQNSLCTLQIEIYSVELRFIFHFVQSCAWFGLVALTKVSVAPAVRDLTCMTAYNSDLITRLTSNIIASRWHCLDNVLASETVTRPILMSRFLLQPGQDPKVRERLSALKGTVPPSLPFL